MEKKRSQSKAQLRNLSQYRDMTDDDFESLWEERNTSTDSYAEFEEKIAKKIEEFGQDYDLDDLKINDKETLRALVKALISLEDYENRVYEIRAQEDITPVNINVIDRIQKIMSDLRKDVSNLQSDLNITRKIRKSDKESSVVSYITALKDQARLFYESKACYVFCPKCNMLLATIWALYPDSDNTLHFECNRHLDEDKNLCGHKFSVTTKQLYENKGTNSTSVMPEGIV